MHNTTMNLTTPHANATPKPHESRIGMRRFWKQSLVLACVGLMLAAPLLSFAAEQALTAVRLATLSSVTLNPTSVTGSTTYVIGTVTLTGPAPSGGVTVRLSSSDAVVATVRVAGIPASKVTVAEGMTSATFMVTTTPVRTSTPVTISASHVTAGPARLLVTQKATLTVLPASLSSLTLNPTDVIGGTPLTGRVTLTGPAPSGGFDVSLTSNSGYAAVPSKVTIQAGATTGTFQITTYPVADPAPFVVPVVIHVSHPPVTKSNVLGVFPPFVRSLELASIVTGGTPLTGRVTLTGPAASGGARVGLSSNNTAVATVPSDVTVAGGTQAKEFSVTTVAGQASTSVTISAQRNPFNIATATLAVVPPALRALVCSPARGDATALCTVSLTGPAPWGAVVNLKSSNTDVITVPATVTVNATTRNFFTRTKRVSNLVVVDISASYAGVTVDDSVTVTPGGVLP